MPFEAFARTRRILCRWFLGLPGTDSRNDIRLLVGSGAIVTHAPMEARNLVHAIEAQRLSKAFTIA